jgi:hypothetical protein
MFGIRVRRDDLLGGGQPAGPARLRLLPVAVAILAATWLSTFTSEVEAAEAAAQQAGASLFVVSGQAGRLEPVGGRAGDFRLVLRGPGSVARFTDRPARRVGDLSPVRLVRDWRRLGFLDDPPNAALVIDDAPANRDVVIVELGRPRLTTSGLRFRVRPVSGRHSLALARFRARADGRGPRRFRRASLFIDPASAQPVTVVFSIQNLTQGGVVGISFGSSWTISDYAVPTLQGPIQALVSSAAGVLITGASTPSTFGLTFRVSGTGNAVTGTAQVPQGTTVTALAPSSQPISSGQFSLPTGG